MASNKRVFAQEVKRVAMAELQRAVAQAERRAIESVAEERSKMERAMVAMAGRDATATADDRVRRAMGAIITCALNSRVVLY